MFKAWTDPKHLEHWWGPRGFTNPVCKMDAKPGGLIHINMRAPNGTIYPMSGVVKEISEPDLFVFTSGALDADGKMIFEILHTVTFTAKGRQTLLTIKARVLKTTTDAAKYLGGHEAGMKQSLDRLAEYLAKR